MTGKRATSPVETTAGTLRGRWNAAGTVAAFKGIPYAQPPVGPLRWRQPQRAIPWEGMREASSLARGRSRALRPNSRSSWTRSWRDKDGVPSGPRRPSCS
ncbi:MAG: carboxylesterase family protein [Thermoleophilia bacterium]